MDGVHDLGGMDGFGAVHVEPDEPVFHQDWEGRVYALNTAMGARGVWNIDVGRFAIESLPPLTYVTSTYYELWLAKLERLLTERAAVLGQGTTFTVDDVGRVLTRGTYVRPATSTPRFATGDRVRARNLHPRGHTRLPRYVRGHVGVVQDVHRPNVFPDSVVRGDGEQPQWLYTVSFEGTELWGEDAEPDTTVAVNAFEPYLDQA
ncbi:nitrile hydratase subunit beta [Mycolicibacterium sediminis]|uniref:Nitrile hydratase subunit beta n=1 Tax=Mycolicibacterium sediminis TaxID=1286180 RepID=A0A7I7QTU8_9MYCO|nr:nitrile hydratase subunit beta [Mycolicibacterium sediminis]BBY29702.1 nitrile hydratase subunit beta [Mycolicibacterium sediminis]